MTRHTAAHTATGLFFAAMAALIAAFAVVWRPTLPGEVVVGAFTAYAIAHTLRKHRHVKKFSEAALIGATVAVLAIVFVPVTLPAGIFLVLAAKPAAHFLDPKKARVVRTTRGVKKPAQRAAGGRPGRAGEAPHKPRRTAASRPASPRPASSPAPRPRAAHRPAESPAPVPAATWPGLEPYRDSDALPWAGEVAPARPRKLRRDKNRPTEVHRQVCGGCAAGECAPGLCKSRGCECAAPVHDQPPF